MVGASALEVQPEEDAETEYAAVRLRLRGVAVSCAVSCVVKTELEPACIAVCILNDDLKTLKSQLWRLRREKGTLQRDAGPRVQYKRCRPR